MTMKQRILQNWTAIRIFYLLIGLFIMVQALMNQEWFVVLIGTYFASMGLLNYGCAAGNCGYQPRMQQSFQKTEEVEYEEVKETNHE